MLLYYLCHSLLYGFISLIMFWDIKLQITIFFLIWKRKSKQKKNMENITNTHVVMIEN